MNREVHVQFCESLRVKLPWATHPAVDCRTNPRQCKSAYPPRVEPVAYSDANRAGNALEAQLRGWVRYGAKLRNEDKSA